MIAPMVFTRDHDIPVSRSGLVVAGFGNQEIFPVVKAYICHGVYSNQLIYSVDSQGSFEGAGCAVLPFAQRDVADSFLQGIDRHNLVLLRRYFAVVCKGLTEILAGTVSVGGNEKAKLIAKLQEATDGALAKWDARIQDHLTEKHIAPLLETVSVLPKEELAVLAEALVNLTSIKRKMSLDVETVGGPTDVAIISKGDGFVWIHRKHYFESAINPHFVQQYLDK
jgi:hypothetical protein